MAGFLYFDARADDARLTLTVARTAALEFGAVMANYTPVVRLTTGADGTPTVQWCGRCPTTRRRSSRSGPAIVVNATGVWADAVRALDEGQDPHCDPAGQGRPRHGAGGAAAV